MTFQYFLPISRPILVDGSYLLIGIVLIGFIGFGLVPNFLEKPCDDNPFRNCICTHKDLVQGYCVAEVEHPTNAEMCGKIVDLLEKAGEIGPEHRADLQIGCVNRSYEMNEIEYFKLKAMNGKFNY